MSKKKKETLHKRHRIGYSFMFSSASLFGITITTCLVFFVMWYFSANNTIMLQNVSVLKIFFLTLVLGTIITLILRRLFICPLIKVTDAMNQVAAGDFSIRLECSEKRSDIIDVYYSFNKMVEELSQTDTLQTDFISNVSHEFKTPINAIEGYASLLQDKNLSEDEQSKYVEKIIFNTKRLSELVGNVLLLSKISNQSIQPKLTCYRLDEQVRYCLLALESKWACKDLSFDIDLDEIEYTGIENLMSHVWTNLIDNAVKFSPYNEEIRIYMNKDEHNAVFRILNQGPYIAPDELDKVFNKFYQCDTSRKSEGNGLGLSLVKLIVNAAGGSVTVQSSKECGTEFTVILPLDSAKGN